MLLLSSEILVHKLLLELLIGPLHSIVPLLHALKDHVLTMQVERAVLGPENFASLALNLKVQFILEYNLMDCLIIAIAAQMLFCLRKLILQ